MLSSLLVALSLGSGVLASGPGPQDPDFLSVDFAADELVSVDPTTGVVKPIGPLGFDVAIGLTMTRYDGSLYLMDAGFGPLPPSLYTVDKTTGAATLAAVLSLPGGTIEFAEALTADAAGLLAVIDDEPGNSSRSKQVVRVNVVTGEFTRLGRMSAGLPGDDGDLDAVVYDPATGDLVGVDGAPMESINYYRRVAPDTGAANEIGDLTNVELDGLVNGLHLENTRLFAVTSGIAPSRGSIAEVAYTGGAVSLVGTIPLVTTTGNYNGLVRATGQPCLADTNNDGQLTPADFTAWINSFNNSLSGCDQNGDGVCSLTDFTAWIGNFNAGY